MLLLWNLRGEVNHFILCTEYVLIYILYSVLGFLCVRTHCAMARTLHVPKYIAKNVKRHVLVFCDFSFACHVAQNKTLNFVLAGGRGPSGVWNCCQLRDYHAAFTVPINVRNGRNVRAESVRTSARVTTIPSNSITIIQISISGRERPGFSQKYLNANRLAWDISLPCPVASPLVVLPGFVSMQSSVANRRAPICSMSVWTVWPQNVQILAFTFTFKMVFPFTFTLPCTLSDRSHKLGSC